MCRPRLGGHLLGRELGAHAEGSSLVVMLLLVVAGAARWPTKTRLVTLYESLLD